ncbi:hypothetical protein FQA39_LY05036 [Lamprigera yunnana]|nr:hypothetical protein FQA39_LY05036 [Lamprigera yunnana]
MPVDSSCELGKTSKENIPISSITEDNEYVHFSEVENDDLNDLNRTDNISEETINNPLIEQHTPKVSTVTITHFDGSIVSNNNSNEEFLDRNNTDCSIPEHWIKFNRVLASWLTKHRITHAALSRVYQEADVGSEVVCTNKGNDFCAPQNSITESSRM